MNNKLTEIINAIKENLRLYLSIILGIFLFLLFFQPFPVGLFDFNNSLLFIAGICAILFIFLVVAGMLFPRFIRYDKQEDYLPILPSYIGGFGYLVLSTLAITFYLRYVGHIEISFFIVFKTVLISGTSLIILRINKTFKTQKSQIETLTKENTKYAQQLDECGNDLINDTVKLASDYGQEDLYLEISKILLLKSADNYVEVVYLEGEEIKKKLIRNTLKNIAEQLKSYTGFMRCHRSFVVNIKYVKELHRRFNNHWLTVDLFDIEIPVSRQYIAKIKEELA